MKRTLFVAALVGAVLAGVVRPASAQAVSIQADVLKDWTSLKDTMMKIADALPEDKFTYKATPAERNFGEQILHVAQVNVMLIGALGGKATAPKFDAKATKKADIVKAMADTFDYGTAVIKEQTDQTMTAAAPAAPPFLGPSTRARVMYGLVGHTWDIYGQMVVYLRLNGAVPPASQRP